jgi:alpha-beta hydrolase superfamily lysophospholipase
MTFKPVKSAATAVFMLLTPTCMATSATLAQPIADASAPADSATSIVTLTASDGRVIDVTVISPEVPRGVILFSHGGGSNPLATSALHARLTARGFAVIAPTHTDSLTLPQERRTDLRAALFTRITDMKLAAGLAETRFPGLPTAQVGYSYGSLISLIGLGAFGKMLPGTNPGVKAVVMFSSPGPIPPLTDAPGAFDAITAPTLLVTGDADIVPGMVEDPSKHLIYWEKLSDGDHTAMVVAGATHEFAAGKQPGWDEVSVLIEDFLMGRVLGDTAASTRFDAATDSVNLSIRRK